jgi:hypothetical protein
MQETCCSLWLLGHSCNSSGLFALQWPVTGVISDSASSLLKEMLSILLHTFSHPHTRPHTCTHPHPPKYPTHLHIPPYTSHTCAHLHTHPRSPFPPPHTPLHNSTHISTPPHTYGHLSQPYINKIYIYWIPSGARNGLVAGKTCYPGVCNAMISFLTLSLSFFLSPLCFYDTYCNLGALPCSRSIIVWVFYS